MEKIRKKLLEILVCPKCKTKVTPEDDTLRCTNEACGLAYPVENGIPVMLIERANTPENSPNPSL